MLPLLGWNSPAEQSLQAVASESGVNFPRAQRTHSVLPSWPWALPGGQLRQLAFSQYFPGLHGEHSGAPTTGETFPTEQPMHSVAPAPAEVPMSQ